MVDKNIFDLKKKRNVDKTVICFVENRQFFQKRFFFSTKKLDLILYKSPVLKIKKKIMVLGSGSKKNIGGGGFFFNGRTEKIGFNIDPVTSAIGVDPQSPPPQLFHWFKPATGENFFRKYWEKH